MPLRLLPQLRMALTTARLREPPNRSWISNTSSAISSSSTSTYQQPTIGLSHCPSCNSPLPTRLPTCPKCSYIAPITPDASYHALLGIPTEPNPFVVNPRVLRSHFLHAQMICHPDAWSGKDGDRQAIAAAQSSLLNKAYQTLLSPVQRAQYLLSQHGQQTTETDQIDDPEFIMEVMEAREQVEEAATEEGINNARERNKERISSTIKVIEQAFADRDYTKAKKASVKLTYWQGIEDAAVAKLRDAGLES